MVVLSVPAALVLPRYIDLDDNARQRAIEAGVSELNGRKAWAWANIKLTPTGFQDDITTFGANDKNLDKVANHRCLFFRL